MLGHSIPSSERVSLAQEIKVIKPDVPIVMVCVQGDNAFKQEFADARRHHWRPNVTLTGVRVNARIAAIMKVPSDDSPVAEAYLHPTSAQSLRELLARKPLSVGDLARMMAVPTERMTDALDGRCPLEISVWKAVATRLNADHTQFSITTDERDGAPCLELYGIWT